MQVDKDITVTFSATDIRNLLERELTNKKLEPLPDGAWNEIHAIVLKCKRQPTRTSR